MSKEKQIEEIAKFICDLDETCEECQKSYNKKYAKVPCWMRDIAENIYNAGYRKQSEGEWVIAVDSVDATFICSKCGYSYIEADPEAKTEYNYCPNCGAKMKGVRDVISRRIKN